MEKTMSLELTGNLTDFCENRKHVYALLSRCYETEIDKAFAQIFTERAALDSEDAALAERFAALQSDLCPCGDAEVEHLAVVFNRAFFGMGPRTAQKAFPYESVYTSEGGLMMQDAYGEVLHIYHDAGFAKAPDFTEPEDHLAVELSYMAALCDRAVDALRVGDEAEVERCFCAQLSFVREHLLNWIDRFAADVQKAAESGFYFNLAAFTKAYLEADEVALAEVVE